MKMMILIIVLLFIALAQDGGADNDFPGPP